MPSLHFLTLRSADPQRALAFYACLGLAFESERHGSGPEHWACAMGALALEIYQATAKSPATPLSFGLLIDDLPGSIERLERLGFSLWRPFEPASQTAVALDPDGRKVWLQSEPSPTH